MPDQRPLYQQRPAAWFVADDAAIVHSLFEQDRDWRLDPVAGAGRQERIKMAHFIGNMRRHRPAAWRVFCQLRRQQNDVTPDAELFRLLWHATPDLRDWVRVHRHLVFAAFQACQDVRPPNLCPVCGLGDTVLVCDIQGSYCTRCGGRPWITP